MTRRYTNAMGDRFVHEVHPRRLSESRNAGRWPTWRDRVAELRAGARAIGEPPIWKGAGLLIVIAATAVLAIVVWSVS